MYNRVLPEFQRFLLSGRIVPEKNVSFYAHWVNKFLSFAGQGAGGDAGLDARMFIDHLKNDPGITDWQLRQAETAIKLYADRFLKNVVPDENTALCLRTNILFLLSASCFFHRSNSILSYSKNITMCA